MEDLTAWYLILAVAIFLIAISTRFSIYTFLVRQSRWLPEKAGSVANTVCVVILVLGLFVLVLKAFLSAR